MLAGCCMLNGGVVPESEARIPIDNIAFTYGYGVYEHLAVRKRVLYFPDEHVARLARSGAQIGLVVPDVKTLLLWLRAFCSHISEESFNIKILVVDKDCYIFASNPAFLQDKQYRDGVSAITIRSERVFPEAKTLSMLPSYLAYAQARAHGAYDALLLDREGFVREGTRTNLFYTDGITLFTPPKGSVLSGVTREQICALVPVVERKLHIDELDSFSYALTSTSLGMIPLTKIDEKSFVVSELMRSAMRAHEAFLASWAAGQKKV